MGVGGCSVRLVYVTEDCGKSFLTYESVFAQEAGDVLHLTAYLAR